jgi:hypothetical protein
VQRSLLAAGVTTMTRRRPLFSQIPCSTDQAGNWASWLVTRKRVTPLHGHLGLGSWRVHKARRSDVRTSKSEPAAAFHGASAAGRISHAEVRCGAQWRGPGWRAWASTDANHASAGLEYARHSQEVLRGQPPARTTPPSYRVLGTPAPENGSRRTALPVFSMGYEAQ